jgi:hypothetical protein
MDFLLFLLAFCAVCYFVFKQIANRKEPTNYNIPKGGRVGGRVFALLLLAAGWTSAAAQVRPQFIEEGGDVPYNPCLTGTITMGGKIDGWNFGSRQWTWVKNLYVHIPYVEGHEKYVGEGDPWVLYFSPPATIERVRWDSPMADDVRCNLIMPGLVMHTPIKVSGSVSTSERQQPPADDGGDDGTGDCVELVGCDDGSGGGGGTGGTGGGDGGDGTLYLICLYNVTQDVTTGQIISKVLVGCTIGY